MKLETKTVFVPVSVCDEIPKFESENEFGRHSIDVFATEDDLKYVGYFDMVTRKFNADGYGDDAEPNKWLKEKKEVFVLTKEEMKFLRIHDFKIAYTIGNGLASMDRTREDFIDGRNKECEQFLKEQGIE